MPVRVWAGHILLRRGGAGFQPADFGALALFTLSTREGLPVRFLQSPLNPMTYVPPTKPKAGVPMLSALRMGDDTGACDARRREIGARGIRSPVRLLDA